MLNVSNVDNINMLGQFKLEWLNVLNEVKEKIRHKAAPVSQKTYGKGLAPIFFAALLEHNRGIEVSEYMLKVCWPDEVPEIFDLILPPNRTEEMILLAIEKCAPELIIEVYLKLYPNKMSSQIIIDAALTKCPDTILDEMLGLLYFS
ncbi:MAG: hypothetical protein DKM50_09835 [Candidatus Margulisiibacteriota bacterium]|nr:MAG: hypothetical protein A2X43_03925 [Candidatus Margulisbacteria bacterium GWD2_39_127]OGI05151.1 MAG: hypothetical protein A2X42_02435 [Candidatus Margulisbacteria bacterium GWF2_38_17]OGI06200.1 MAG: hypothetical protein A2X41_08015 [Candidatus Margulisbacteria bacterium GWE2_39_32]PZM78855.1 MAG: hypothetical protein DKM50_09835 [Candidatus Margulisiibacteriota bacterium]HAR64566.1 hypothetical protein [Candidatus Margulisiibacteriota bacterium]